MTTCCIICQCAKDRPFCGSPRVAGSRRYQSAEVPKQLKYVAEFFDGVF